VFGRHHGGDVPRTGVQRVSAAPRSANQQSPSKRHDGEEKSEDQEDAVALRLYLSRQSTHLLIFGASACRRDAPSRHVSMSKRSSLRKPMIRDQRPGKKKRACLRRLSLVAPKSVGCFTGRDRPICC